MGFLLRFLLFGFDAACLYLQRIPKAAIIPILRSFGATIGDNCDINTGVTIHNCHNFKNLEIGSNCHIGKGCFMDLRDKIVIKNNVVISMQCTMLTHIDLTQSDLSDQYQVVQGPVYILDHVYIGARATILKGITIREKSFIAANSLVNTNIQRNTLVGGIPAKRIKNLNV